MEPQGENQVAPDNTAIDSPMTMSAEQGEAQRRVRKPSKPEVDSALKTELYLTILEQIKTNTELLYKAKNQKAQVQIEQTFSTEQDDSTEASGKSTVSLDKLPNLFQELFNVISELKAVTLGEEGEPQRDSGISLRSSGLSRTSQIEDGLIQIDEELSAQTEKQAQTRPVSQAMAIRQGSVCQDNRRGRSRTNENREQAEAGYTQGEQSGPDGRGVDQFSDRSDFSATLTDDFKFQSSSDQMDQTDQHPDDGLGSSNLEDSTKDDANQKTQRDNGVKQTPEAVENEDQSPNDTSSDSSEDVS